jgi:hypothetical protein
MWDFNPDLHWSDLKAPLLTITATAAVVCACWLLVHGFFWLLEQL